MCRNCQVYGKTLERSKEKKAKQDEKIQEVHWGVGNCIWYWNDASQPDASDYIQGQIKVQSQSQT